MLNQITYKRAFDGWSMACRREPALGHCDTFPAIVRYLTEQVEDGQLKRQIRSFSAMFMAGPPRETADVWPIAL